MDRMKHFEDMFEYRPLRGCKVSAFLFRKPNPEIQNEIAKPPLLPTPRIDWAPPPSDHGDNYYNDMPLSSSMPMLHWTPFGGEVREMRPDPMYRPTFNNLVENSPHNDMWRMPSHTRRRRRRSSPLQRKQSAQKRSPKNGVRNGPPVRRASGGDSVNSPSFKGSSAKISTKFDFTADNLNL